MWNPKCLSFSRGSLLYWFEYGGTRHGSLSRGGLGSGPTVVVFARKCLDFNVEPLSVLVLVWGSLLDPQVSWF